jgi:hypothetical protein
MFQTESLIDNNIFRQYIKTKTGSKTIHLKFIGSADYDSLFTVSVKGTSQITNPGAVSYKPGSQGIVSYKMLESDAVEVIFKPITCDTKDCLASIDYFLIIAENL